MYKIYVVLLNYNGYNDTKECIESILKGQNNMYFNINICVVDNDSTQEERKLLFNLKNKIKNLDIIFNNTNEGYAKGNNIGISFAIKNQADYIWVLNNDVTVEENAVNELIKSAKNSEAFFSTKIYDYYYRNELQYFGADIVGKKFDIYFNKIDGKINRNSDFISGTSIFAHRNLWEKYKLPEEYFLYEEDTDFSLYLKENNIPIIIVANAKIFHKGSVSTNKLSWMQHYYFQRNKLILIKKYSKNPWKSYFFIKKFIIFPCITLRRYIKGIIFNNEYRYLAKYEWMAWSDFILGKVGKRN